MAIPWPEVLGTPTIEGYSIQPQGRVKRTEVFGGPPRFKRVNVSAPINVTARWVWRPSEFETFSQTLRVALNDGEKATTMLLRVERGVPEVYTCYFAGQISSSWDGVTYVVRAELEVIPIPFPAIDPSLFYDQIDGGLASAPSAGGPIDAGTPASPADPANSINIGGPSAIP